MWWHLCNMKNILIPTDFSPGSLDMIATVAAGADAKVNVILFHAFDMPVSLVDAMVRTGANGHYSMVTENLRVKCRKIKTTNQMVGNISFRFMYGTSAALFRNFAAANRLDMIALPENYFFVPVVRESVNPQHMFKKSGIPVQLFSSVVASVPVRYASSNETRDRLVSLAGE